MSQALLQVQCLLRSVGNLAKPQGSLFLSLAVLD